MYLCDDLFYKMPLSAIGRVKSKNKGRAIAYNELSSISFVLGVSAVFLHKIFQVECIDSVRSKSDLLFTMAKITATAPMVQGSLTREKQMC